MIKMEGFVRIPASLRWMGLSKNYERYLYTNQSTGVSHHRKIDKPFFVFPSYVMNYEINQILVYVKFNDEWF